MPTESASCTNANSDAHLPSRSITAKQSVPTMPASTAAASRSPSEAVRSVPSHVSPAWMPVERMTDEVTTGDHDLVSAVDHPKVQVELPALTPPKLRLLTHR